MTPQRIIWHHSGDPIQEHQLKKIDRYHRSRDFPKSALGFYVGYHYLIEYDGTLVKCRMDEEIGAHDQGENPDSIGICLAGDFSKGMPNDEQIVTAVSLLAYLRDRWEIPLTRIEPHRWDDETECPGTLLEDNWLVEQYLEREGNPLLRLYWYLSQLFKLL